MQIGEFIEDLRRDFLLTTDDLKKIVEDFHGEMRRGLAGGRGSLKMLPAHIDCAGGRELGKFLAIDLGGTNLRTLRVRLSGRGRAKIERVRKFRIPESAMHGCGESLFDLIAKSIKPFIGKIDGGQRLGFTFSFPFEQDGVANGKLISWTKGFSATGVVGKDVAVLLRDALRRNRIDQIEIAALVNDAVGTLIAGSYADERCDIGAIFGTGTNACYRERASNIKKLKKSCADKDGHMIVNTEWGNFDRLPLNEYDRILDAGTNNPKCQLLEKMISGMYLKRIALIVIEDMIRRKIIFGGRMSARLRGDFGTGDMAAIESDDTKNLLRTKSILRRMGIANSSFVERAALRDICNIVSGRAARIGAAALYAVVTWIDPKITDKHTLAMDGTLFEKYPKFRDRVSATLKVLNPDNADKIRIIHAEDGSGVGAAIAAAVAAADSTSKNISKPRNLFCDASIRRTR